MENFQLQLFLKILGIGSASGILYLNQSLFIISDNSTYLYEYKIENDTLQKHTLVENPQENIPKKEKLDFEVLAQKNNKLHILGSGSKEKRNKKIKYNIENQKVKSKDISKLYQKCIKKANINEEDLNIEGCVIHQHITLFFQRGNGAQGKNGIFIIENKRKVKDFVSIKLPKIQNIEATFTDAILVDDKIYFLAAVENSNSTYNDGEILGTFLGILDFKKLELEKTILISEKNKFEGIAFYQQSNSELEFLVCEDADNEVLESLIYKIVLKK